MTPANLAVLSDQEQSLHQEVQSLAVVKVVNPETYAQAGERCKAIVSLEKKVKEYWDPVVDSAYKTWKSLVAKRAEFLDPLAANKKAQTDGMKAFEWEQEKIRREAERLAQEKAAKEAEDDVLADAEDLEKRGFKEAAEALVNKPVPVPQVVIPKTTPAGFGTFTKKNYKAKVIDIKALARAVLAGTVPEQAITGNDVFLGQQARSLKDAMKWPGVKVWAE